MEFSIAYPRDCDASVYDDPQAVVQARNTGSFWRSCPGTTGRYLCCGYQILTPLIGCGMQCRYCILQSYFSHRCHVLFDNREDMRREIAEKMTRFPRRIVRFGTGEFADSLYLDERLGLSVWLADMLSAYDTVLCEFKTKSVHIGRLAEIKNRHQIIIGFSMSPQRWIDRYENNTASLSQRLEAAARCEQMGFWVSFHFDPMIYHPDWEREYRDLVRRIFATIHDPADIAWWSMGGFRTMPSLKKTLQHTNTHLPLFSGEMIMGEDHKLRYFRSIRRDFYRAVRQEVDACYPLTTLYMCMESPEVWQDAGMARRIPRGLIHYLDTRAGEMLQTRKKNGKNTEQ